MQILCLNSSLAVDAMLSFKLSEKGQLGTGLSSQVSMYQTGSIFSMIIMYVCGLQARSKSVEEAVEAFANSPVYVTVKQKGRKSRQS